MGAQHLIDLGHRNILIAASSLRLANIRQRCAGAAEALHSCGLPKPAIVELGLSIDAACSRLSEWFERNRAPTAIQALTNFTTLSVLTTAAERGLRLPEDISLIGFDDYAWMSARVTPLTAICQPVREMGGTLWERLSVRIRGDQSPPVHVQIPCDLRVRASTAGPSAHSPSCGQLKPVTRAPREAAE
jgi:LacI family transcriptional regulator